MGALTGKKRGDDYYKCLGSVSPPIDQSYGHISKKLKFSSMNENTPSFNLPASSSKSVSRVSRYPDPKQGFQREVHAPVRNLRFGSFSSSKKIGIGASTVESSGDKMGRFSWFHRLWSYEKVKHAAIGSLRYLGVEDEVSAGKQKEKEVIEVDSEEEENRDDVMDDSSVEEDDFVESKRKGREIAVENFKDSSVVTNLSNADGKVDGMEKMDLMVLDEEPDSSGEPLYRRLHDMTKKRDPKLNSLMFDIELHERHSRWFSIRPPKKAEQIKDVAEECFVPLTEEEESQVSRALSNAYRRKVLVTHENSNIEITGETIQCLRPKAWLNDEVINLYLDLLKERENREPQKFLKCHFFNTFFYKKLISGRGGYNFQSVRRWTTQRKLGYSLLDCEKIFVPIHKEIHWCLAIINKKDKKFQYLDSLKGVDTQVLNVLARYFVDEVKDKCGKDINVSSWEQEYVTELPEQANGFDCGVFMIKYADFYSRDVGLCFSQQHMPYFRRRTAKEILKLRAE